jgi:hypothetical protein
MKIINKQYFPKLKHKFFQNKSKNMFCSMKLHFFYSKSSVFFELRVESGELRVNYYFQLLVISFQKRLKAGN